MGSTEKKANFSNNSEEEEPKSTNKQNESSGGTRPRNDSTSSGDSSRSYSWDRLKRRRTTSLTSSSPLSSFFFPNSPEEGLSSSPVEYMSLDEVMSAKNGITNMAIAHEIALDPNFKLEPKQSTLEKQVKEVVHQAFWDHLQEQLSCDPPVYTQAFVLLQEVHDQLMQITLPHQTKLRNEISERLDVALIKQQAENGVLDFNEVSQFVVAQMARLCAPVRDDAIAALRRETNVVKVFRGVAETLELMRLDMANYTIQMVRPTICKQIVEYERTKFAEFLKTQRDGLELTRKWILEHVDLILDPPSGSTENPSVLLADPLAMKNFITKVLNSAYMGLLSWPKDRLVPEVVAVDTERVLELRDRLHQICLLGTVQLLTIGTAAPFVPSESHNDLRARLKRDLCPLLDPAFTHEQTIETLPNIAQQAVTTVEAFLKEKSLPPPPVPSLKSLKEQLLSLPSHQITNIVTSRSHGFISLVLSSPSPRGITVPLPLQLLQEEVSHIIKSFMTVTNHNKAVFGEFYHKMMEEALRDRLDKASEQSSQESLSGEHHSSDPQVQGSSESDIEKSESSEVRESNLTEIQKCDSKSESCNSSESESVEILSSESKTEKSSELKIEKSSESKTEKSSELKIEKSSESKTEKSSETKTEESSELKIEKSSESKTEKSNSELEDENLIPSETS